MGLDVIIAGRGGGSIEDLWAFNEPMVVEAVFDAQTPIISAVGHETDFTITDFVADLRAPTPSAAAELAVADISLIEQKIMAYNETLNSSLMGIIDGKRNYLDKCELKLRFLSPSNQLDENRQRLMGIEDSLNNIMMNKYKDARHRLQIYASRLQEASPLTRLSAGYAYVQNENGEKVSSVRKLKRGDKLKVQFKDGYADTSVDSVTAD